MRGNLNFLDFLAICFGVCGLGWMNYSFVVQEGKVNLYHLLVTGLTMYALKFLADRRSKEK